MQYKKEIVLLVLLTTLIPELFTGSTSFDVLVNPTVLWGYLIGYGIAILFLREIATRCELSYGGVFILGMAYSFFNEGLLAKTYLIFQDDPVNTLINLPVDFLANMGNFFGLNFGFTLTSAVWHGVGSVLIPICLVHYLYPQSATTPWLKKGMVTILGAFLLLAGTTTFLSPEKIQGTPNMLTVIIMCMSFLFLFSLKFKRTITSFPTPSITRPYVPFLLGLSVGIFYLVILNIIGSKGNLIPYLLVFCIGVGGYITILMKNGWITAIGLLFFGIGFYAQTLLIPLPFLHTPVSIATALIAYIILGMTYVWMKRRHFLVLNSQLEEKFKN